jgi:hypothetical protein
MNRRRNRRLRLGGGQILDPLAALNDTFSGAALLSKWTAYQGDGTLSTAVSGGELNLTCNAGGAGDSFWYNAEQGVLLYQLVTGDFDARARVRVRNLADDGLPTVGDGNYRIAGIAAHDPDRATDLDYVHVGLGCTASATLTAEWKDTQASTSYFADYTDADVQTGEGEIRLLREGQVYTFYYRPLAGGAWVELQVRGRGGAPLPDTLQLGFVVYASVASHDIRIFADDFRVTTP